MPGLLAGVIEVRYGFDANCQRPTLLCVRGNADRNRTQLALLQPKCESRTQCAKADDLVWRHL